MGKGIGHMKFSIRARFEVEHMLHGFQVERTVDVGKQLVGFIRARFPAKLGLELSRVNLQDHQTVLVGIVRIGYAQNLIYFGAMDETLARQRISGIHTALWRGRPGGPGSDVVDEFGHGFTSPPSGTSYMTVFPSR